MTVNIHDLNLKPSLLIITYSDALQDVFKRMKPAAVNDWKAQHVNKLRAFVAAQIAALPPDASVDDLPVSVDYKSRCGVLRIVTNIGLLEPEYGYLPFGASTMLHKQRHQRGKARHEATSASHLQR